MIPTKTFVHSVSFPNLSPQFLHALDISVIMKERYFNYY